MVDSDDQAMAVLVKLSELLSPSPRIRRRWVVPAIVCAVAAAFLVQPAVADEGDTLNVTVGVTRTYSDNVFSVPDTSPKQSDFSSVYSVGVRLDKPYSLQRFQLNATESRTRYDDLPNLDSDSRNYRAAWLWALTPHLTGTLSEDRVQSQIPFSLIGGTQLNQSTSKSRNFNLDGWVGGAWHVMAGYGTSTSTTTQAILSAPATSSHNYNAGLRYVARSGNTITFLQRWLPTENTDISLDPTNLIDTQFTDRESDLSVTWRPTGKSSFDGGVTYKTRDNLHFSQRNFSGTAARLIYGWTPTGKLSINVSALRTILPYAAFGNTLENSTYVVNQTLTLGAGWSISGKTSANLSFSRTHSDFRGPVFAVTSPARIDDLNVAQVGISWAADRWISLSASVVHSDRSSNIGSFQFNGNVAQIGAALRF